MKILDNIESNIQNSKYKNGILRWILYTILIYHFLEKHFIKYLYHTI